MLVRYGCNFVEFNKGNSELYIVSNPDGCHSVIEIQIEIDITVISTIYTL